MLDQSAQMNEATESITVEVVHVENLESEWAAVLAAAPAMGRLPDMVAATYNNEEAFDSPEEMRETQEQIRSRLQLGIVFVYKVIETNLNPLFEKFDVRLGSAIDLFVDDLEASYGEDQETVENYSVEEVCGRLFGYLAMEVYCRHRCDESVDDGTEVDDQTGFYKDMEVLPVLIALESVLDCVRMTPELKVVTRRQAQLVIHTHIFLLLDANKNTVLH